MELNGIGEESKSVLASRKVDLNIKGENFSGLLSGVLVIDKLALPAQLIDRDMVEFCKVKTSIERKSYFKASDMLIGQNHGNLMITRTSGRC